MAWGFGTLVLCCHGLLETRSYVSHSGQDTKLERLQAQAFVGTLTFQGRTPVPGGCFQATRSTTAVCASQNHRVFSGREFFRLMAQSH